MWDNWLHADRDVGACMIYLTESEPRAARSGGGGVPRPLRRSFAGGRLPACERLAACMNVMLIQLRCPPIMSYDYAHALSLTRRPKCTVVFVYPPTWLKHVHHTHQRGLHTPTGWPTYIHPQGGLSTNRGSSRRSILWFRFRSCRQR